MGKPDVVMQTPDTLRDGKKIMRNNPGILSLVLLLITTLPLLPAQAVPGDEPIRLRPGHYAAVAAQATEGAYPGETVIGSVDLVIEITRTDVSGHVWGRVSLDRETGTANGYVDNDHVLHLTGTLKHPVLSGVRNFTLTATVTENGLIHGYFRKESQSLLSSGAFNRALPVKK